MAFMWSVPILFTWRRVVSSFQPATSNTQLVFSVLQIDHAWCIVLFGGIMYSWSYFFFKDHGCGWSMSSADGTFSHYSTKNGLICVFTRGTIVARRLNNRGREKGRLHILELILPPRTEQEISKDGGGSTLNSPLEHQREPFANNGWLDRTFFRSTRTIGSHGSIHFCKRSFFLPNGTLHMDFNKCKIAVY
jgi:hypothetical protein